MSKLLNLSFLLILFNVIQASTLPRIRPGVVAENVVKMDSAVDPEERAVNVLQNVAIDLCKQDFADLHADMTTSANEAIVYTLTITCNRNFTFYYLQLLQGYTVEAFQGALDTGKAIPITGNKIEESFSFPAGVISVRITRQANAGSYHQLVASRSDYMVTSNQFISGTGMQYNRKVQFPKGTEQYYIFYQPANTTEGNNGILLSYSGDCQSATIWKGVQQTESTRIYGGSTSICSRNVYRDGQPTFVFGHFLTVAPGKPDNCTINYGYSKQPNGPIYVNPKTSGVVSSPAFSSASQPRQIQNQQVDFTFVRNTGVDKIYFQLFTLIANNSQLIVMEMDSGSVENFNSTSNLCSFASTETRIQISYKWNCGQPPCEDGLILKWSTENPDTDAGNSISFLFNLSLIVFLANIFK